MWTFCQRRESLRRVAADLREGMKDEAEGMLHKAVLQGEPWAVKFYLLTQAKDSGYSTRTELAGASDVPPVPVQFIEVAQSAERNGDGD